LLDNRTDNHTHTNYNNEHEIQFIYTLKVFLPKLWENLPDPSALGEHIRLARLKKGWQIKELAEKIGADQMLITHWEKNQTKPEYAYVRRLKEVLPKLTQLPPNLIYPDFPIDPKREAERFKQERLSLDLSQSEMAKRLGVCEDTV